MEDLSRAKLIELCKRRSIKGYSKLNCKEIIQLLQQNVDIEHVIPTKIQRLNYIGSKFKLLDWITDIIKEKTGSNLDGKKIADLFSGTGIVSHHFRGLSAKVISNDAELYSYIITKALTCSVYSEKLQDIIDRLNSVQGISGYITQNYSPYENNERKFFTIINAMKIDSIRQKIEDMKDTLSEEEYIFLLASLIVSADAVSNVPAVYGCYLKNFKTTANKSLQLKPIHTLVEVPHADNIVYNNNVIELAESLPDYDIDIVYLDPPYNERQYSKNYFPLNMIAKTPTQLETEPDLKGKTGIPVDCFMSDFCKKAGALEAFKKLIDSLHKKTKWIFISYNSESIVPKDKMMELLGSYGIVTCVEQDYKRFKSFEYNKDVSIQEYLFCLEVIRD